MKQSKTLLLPAKYSDENNHVRFIDGHYCCPQCLVDKLKLLVSDLIK